MIDEAANRQRFEELFAEMLTESDRGCILIGASVLDEVLATLLRKYLGQNEHVINHAVKPLFSSMGPLSSFSAHIKLAYCLRLVEKWEFEDLEGIRKIRNKAAHEYTAKTFLDKEIIHISQQLKGADHAVTAMEKYGSVLGKSEAQLSKDTSGTPISKERIRFQLTVIYLAARFDMFSRQSNEFLVQSTLLDALKKSR